MLPANEHTLYVKIQGEDTKEWFEGSFTFKCLLNQAEKVEVAVRTDRYNQGSTTISPQHALINRTIAELEMRTIKAPTWWTENGNGRLLYDTNVVFHVFKEAFEAEAAFKKKLEDKIKAATAATAATATQEATS